MTPHTVRSKSRLRKELQTVKATGFAYSREEFTLGITAIAAAVRSGAKLHGAIIWRADGTFHADRDAEFREALRRTAQLVAKEISRERQ